MDISKKDFVEWMQEYNHADDYVARYCNVTPETVMNWRTSKKRPLPRTQIATIRKLMKKDHSNEQSQNLVIEVSPSQFKDFEDVARKENFDHVQDWAKHNLLEKIQTKS